MKRVTLLCIGLSLALCSFITKRSNAQTVYSIPSSSCSSCQNGAYGPVDICDGRYTAESDIFPSSSLTFGTVTAIAYDQLSGSASNVPIKIYMMNTSSSTQTAQSWSSELSGATLVYSGNVSFTSNGWKTITLNSSFTYSSGNLEVLVETDWGASTVCTGNPVFYYYTASSNIDEFWEGTANSSSALQSETGVIGDQPAPIQVTTTACSNPSISSQPSSSTQNICQGGTATALSVTASGTSLTYQWYKNTSSSNSGGTSISGATSSSYTPPTTTTGTLYYYCVVSSLGCSSTSSVSGAININTIPTINSQSTGGQNLCQGSTATAISVSATGTSLTYQWYSNSANSNGGGTSISGATSSSYTPSTTNTGTLYYYCTVYSNGGCPVTSAVSGAMVVSGTSAPTGTSPQIFCSSSSPTVASLTATGTSIQWYSAATGGTALNSTTALATGTYYATQTVSGCQSVTRLSVSVTVNQAPTIVSQSMGPQSICKDSFAIPMTINATGTSLTYQWYSDSVAATSGGKLIAGATTSSYTPSTLKTGTTYYYCVVSGTSPCGPVTSSASGAFACYLCNVNGIVAGGDLSGTYPNPTVAKINGCTVPPSSTGYLYNNGAGTLSWSLGGIWNQNGNNIDYITGNVGIGTTTPNYLLEVNGNAAVTGNFYGQNIYAAGNLSAGNFRFVNGTAVGTADSIVSSAPALQLSANSVSVSTDTFKVDSNLTVTRNRVNVPGTLSAGNVQTPTLTITDNISSPVVYVGHIKPMAGDSAVHIGDSSFALQTAGYSKGDIYFTPRFVGALGISDLFGNSTNYSYSLGYGNQNNANYTLTIGSHLTNATSYSIMMGMNLNPTQPYIPALFINGSNQVGIGTTSPIGDFQINNGTSALNIGSVQEDPSSGYITNYIGFNAGRNGGLWQTNTDTYSNGGAMILGDVGGNIYFSNLRSTGGTGQTNVTDAQIYQRSSMMINSSGKVIIGNPFGATPITTASVNTPGQYTLYVAGGILTEQLTVAIANSNGWADYVFANNYKLKPLAEVAAYIKENNHLPDVPSASDVKDSGMNVATMDVTLLKKVEELTLYIIQQQQQIKDLQDKVNVLKKEIGK